MSTTARFLLVGVFAVITMALMGCGTESYSDSLQDAQTTTTGAR